MKDSEETILKAEIDKITKNIDNILKKIEKNDFIKQLSSQQSNA